MIFYLLVTLTLLTSHRLKSSENKIREWQLALNVCGEWFYKYYHLPILYWLTFLFVFHDHLPSFWKYYKMRRLLMRAFLLHFIWLRKFGIRYAYMMKFNPLWPVNIARTSLPLIRFFFRVRRFLLLNSCLWKIILRILL